MITIYQEPTDGHLLQRNWVFAVAGCSIARLNSRHERALHQAHIARVLDSLYAQQSAECPPMRSTAHRRKDHA